jgi:hypothetical protein
LHTLFSLIFHLSFSIDQIAFVKKKSLFFFCKNKQRPVRQFSLNILFATFDLSECFLNDTVNDWASSRYHISYVFRIYFSILISISMIFWTKTTLYTYFMTLQDHRLQGTY